MIARAAARLLRESRAVAESVAAGAVPRWAPGASPAGVRSRFLKTESIKLRSGNFVELDGKLFQVVKQQHSRGTARQHGNVQLELRDVQTRKNTKKTMRPSSTVDLVRLEGEKHSLLYAEGDDIHIMDDSTFDMKVVSADLFGDQAKTVQEVLLSDEKVTVTVLMHRGDPVVCELPATIELDIHACEPSSRKDHVSPQYKSAHLRGGTRVMVPHFLEPGDRIVVDSTSREFVKKA